MSVSHDVSSLIDDIIEGLDDDPEVYRVDEDVDDTVVVEMIDGTVFDVRVSLREEDQAH